MKKSADRERGGGRRRPPQMQTERSPSVRFPRCRILAWAALILAILLSGVLAVFPLTDADIWWHLRTGEMVVTEGAVPHADPFTYTAQGRHWVTHEWLAEVVFYGLHRLGGINLLIVFKALLALAAMGLGAAAALVGSDRGNRVAPAALGVLLGGLLLADRAFARPHMFTAVFLGATLLLLRLDGVSGRFWYRLALVPLFLLWANLHSGFVLGLLMILLYWIGEGLTLRSGGTARRTPPAWRTRIVTLAVVALATLVNPHHIHALLYPFQIVGREEIRGSIVELRSIFHPAYRGGLLLHTLIATGGLLVLVLAGSFRRLDAAILLPGLLFGLLGLRSIRGITEFAVLVPALMAVHGGWIGRRVIPSCGVALGTLLLSLAGGALLGLRGVPLGENVRRPLGFGVNPARAPEEAVRFLENVRPEGRMFNVLVFGGYLIHTLWPEYPVYIDGRLDVFPPGFLDNYGDLMGTGRGWDEICRRHGITIAVVDYDRDPGRETGLRARLRNDPDWTCVFFSGNALVYLRRGGGNDAILSRYGCPYDPGDRTPESIRRWVAGAPPGEVTRAISSLEAMAATVPRNPFQLVVLGQMLDACGRSAEGAAWMRKALALEPPPPEALLLFGWTLMRAGELDEARRQVETVLAEEPDRIDGLLLQAEVELRDGDSGAARGVLERAARLSPGTYHVWLRLGILSADEGRTGEAEAYFRRALSLRPGDPEVNRRLEALHDLASP